MGLTPAGRAWEVRRPAVLLRAAAEDWDDDQRRNVLVHELAHVARHDWLSQLGARAVCALRTASRWTP